jgi:hypothetical protein
MGGHRTDFDELKAFERLCLELVAAAAMPEERAGLEIMASNYRAAILDAQTRHAFCKHSANWRLFPSTAIYR